MTAPKKQPGRRRKVKNTVNQGYFEQGEELLPESPAVPPAEFPSPAPFEPDPEPVTFRSANGHKESRVEPLPDYSEPPAAQDFPRESRGDFDVAELTFPRSAPRAETPPPSAPFSGETPAPAPSPAPETNGHHSPAMENGSHGPNGQPERNDSRHQGGPRGPFRGRRGQQQGPYRGRPRQPYADGPPGEPPYRNGGPEGYGPPRDGRRMDGYPPRFDRYADPRYTDGPPVDPRGEYPRGGYEEGPRRRQPGPHGNQGGYGGRNFGPPGFGGQRKRKGPGFGKGLPRGPRFEGPPAHSQFPNDVPLQTGAEDPFAPGETQPPQADLLAATGILEIHPSKGHGFLRNPSYNLASHPTDVFVPPHLIQKFGLREGLKVGGFCDPRNLPGQGPRLLRIDTIEDLPLTQYVPREFDTLTPIDPHERIVLETGREPVTTRVMDLLTPIGRGQRGLIVAPPRTGKTVLLQHIAKAISTNQPDMHLIVLLIDERPEEVTEMKRTVRGEVLASSSDKDASQHVRLAELVLNRARRLAEMGKPVFILLDSLTRLARAYNKASNSGRTLSGGVDSKALDIPKKLFGCARVFEEGGSITVMGTALIETGSKMDEVIFQELKGTGNMELVLDRKLADRRIYPAIDIGQSGTRKEEKLLGELAPRIATLRRVLVDQSPIEGMEKLVRKLSETETNEQFLDKMIVKKK